MTDQLSLNVIPQIPAKMTKRNLLSQVAQIYDPMWFAAAFTIRLNIAPQERQIGVDWDDEISVDKWILLLKEMKKLKSNALYTWEHVIKSL